MKLENKWALITGASSGMGTDYAHILAQKKMNLVLSARREDRLIDLKNHIELKYNVKVIVLVKDLADQHSPKEIFNELVSSDIKIEVLINNAGYGINSYFKTQELSNLHNMIDLNIKSLVSLTKIFMDDMLLRKSGYILQVASIAAFNAIPMYAIYGASKSFVVNFGQATNIELKGTGVSVTTLCPGTTKTEFFEVSGHEMSNSQKALMMESRVVSEIGIRAMLKRKSIIVPGVMNKITVMFMKIAPRDLVAALALRLMK